MMKRSLPIRSMTGFGKGESSSKGRRAAIEIKSVNNRFLDLQFRGHHLSAEAENQVLNQLKQSVERGTVTINVSLSDENSKSQQPKLNTELLAAYQKIHAQACKQLKIKESAPASFFLGLPDVIATSHHDEEDVLLGELIRNALNEAISSLNKMRIKEGEALAADLEKRILHIREIAGRIEKETPQRTAIYKARLEKKLSDLFTTAPDDVLRTRLLTEVTLMADKTDTSEETTRLASHLEQFLGALKSGGAVGKKLNFLQQEIYREANTISSKASQPEVVELCIAMKEESEKIREQIQNLE